MKWQLCVFAAVGGRRLTGGSFMEKVKRTPASLKNMVETFNMEILHKGRDFDNTVVTISDVNRPALQLVGFYDYFDDKRLQILGRGEMQFLERMTEAERTRVFNKLLSYPFPAMIVARDMEAPSELVQMANKHDRTLLRSAESTVDVTSKLIDYLNRAMAPQIARHGVLMNIYGQGVLILGDSGIGKSETAIELLKRGHRLVADDAVEIRRISNNLFGTAPEIIRHYIEIRGVGVIDVQQLFGMGAVQFDTEIDLVIQLEQWVDGKFYDRLGLGEEKYEMLGVELPIVTIPVRPGRNLAGIVEIATMKNRQMKYGYNAARDFVTQFDSKMDAMIKENRAK
jgi:HPr kinase/phosphorylase